MAVAVAMVNAAAQFNLGQHSGADDVVANGIVRSPFDLARK